MPLWTPASRTGFNTNNFGATPSALVGTSVVPGASNVEGTYTQLLTAVAQDVAGFYLRISEGATASAAKNHLLDIGIDPAGGSTYTAIISNIVCGASATMVATGGAHRFFFPMRIPSGASVAARIQGSNATAGTVRVGIKVYFGRQQAAPWMLPVGQYSETLGTITNSNGVSFTPGTAAQGTWVTLGSTTRDLWWWQIGYQVDNTIITSEYAQVQIGFGPTANQTIIMTRYNGGTTNESCGDTHGNQLIWHECYCPVPGGTEIWVRGMADTAPDSGYNAVAIGIGG